MMAEPPLDRRDRVLLGLGGLIGGLLLLASPKLIVWWLVFASAQLDALAGLLGWR